MTPDICFLVFAHVRHVRQNFGSHTSILQELLNIAKEMTMLKNQ